MWNALMKNDRVRWKNKEGIIIDRGMTFGKPFVVVQFMSPFPERKHFRGESSIKELKKI